jgi:type VII secretion integral membrane protein EccD
VSSVPPGLVRVTVTSGTRSTDLALPGAVHVADLVPELARCVGVLDRSRAFGGYRAVTRCGAALRHDLGLTAQGVTHGDVITIVAAADDEPPVRHDDPVEAMTLVAAQEAQPWSPVAARQVTLAVTAALLLGGAATLVSQHASTDASPASALACAISVTLLVGTTALSRTQPTTAVAVALAHFACLYAAVAALCRHPWMSGTTLAEAGTAVLGVGLAATWGLQERRMLVVPAIAMGAAGSLTGLLMRATGVPPAVLLTAALAAVVMSSCWFPGLALSASGAGRHVRPIASAPVQTAVLPIDLASLRADVRRARDILVAASATAGVLLVVLAPVAVACGPAGFAVPTLGSAVVVLRCRRYRTSLDVLVGVASGALGLASTLLSLLWLHAEWRLAIGALMAGAGIVLLAPLLLPIGGDARLGRLGDRIESAALVLLPVTVLAAGISFARR